MSASRGVGLSDLKAKHGDSRSWSHMSEEEKVERAKKFFAVALNSRAFVDKALALHLPIDDADSLEPLAQFANDRVEKEDVFLSTKAFEVDESFGSRKLPSCMLPQLKQLNDHKDTNSLLCKLSRGLNFEFKEVDESINAPDGSINAPRSRTLDLWNQMGGDLMQVMAAMRIVKMSLSDDRPDGLRGNADADQLDEMINTNRRVSAMTMSELAVKARLTIVNERKACDSGLSDRLKEHVFRPLDEVSAMSSLQFGCCQAMRTIIGGMKKLQDTDTLLELTMKQACEDSNMEWFRYHLRTEMRRAAQDVYSFAEGKSTESMTDFENVDVGLEPSSALRPPWVDRNENLGDWREEGCYVVIVPLLNGSLTASTIVGASTVPGSLITSALTENGDVDMRRLRTPVAFCFVDGRGWVLDRGQMKDKNIELPEDPDAPSQESSDHNVFLTDCGTKLMLALTRACDFKGTVFMTP